MSDLPAINPDLQNGAILVHVGRGRVALATATARLALMASIAGTLALRGFADARPGTPLYSPIFDLVVPLVFAAMALWLAGRALITLFHFAFAGAPVVSVTPTGLVAPATAVAPIPWAAIADARVVRARGSAALVVDLLPGAGVRTRVWPFTQTGTITLWVADPDAACVAIHAYLDYRGAPLPNP